MNPLDIAIQFLGSQAALAKRLGIVQSAVANWRARSSVPAEYCPAIEAATDGKVTCEQLRPDVHWHVLRNTAFQGLPELAAGNIATT